MPIELKLPVTHRYESGIKQAVIDANTTYIAHLAGNKSMVIHYLHGHKQELQTEVHHESPPMDLFEEGINTITIINERDSKYFCCI